MSCSYWGFVRFSELRAILAGSNPSLVWLPQNRAPAGMSIRRRAASILIFLGTVIKFDGRVHPYIHKWWLEIVFLVRSRSSFSGACSLIGGNWKWCAKIVEEVVDAGLKGDGERVREDILCAAESVSWSLDWSLSSLSGGLLLYSWGKIILSYKKLSVLFHTWSYIRGSICTPEGPACYSVSGVELSLWFLSAIVLVTSSQSSSVELCVLLSSSLLLSSSFSFELRGASLLYQSRNNGESNEKLALITISYLFICISRNLC